MLPETDGFEKLWGRDVYHFPYYHGYEVRDEPLGVLVTAPEQLEHTKLIYNLSTDLVDQFGLQVNESGLVETTQSQYGIGFMSVKGLFVVGDASSESVLSIPSAVADGSIVGGLSI